MKPTLLFVFALGAVAFAGQQTQKRVLVNDKKGEFKIYDVESAVTSFRPGGGMDFEASGSPLRGFSKPQGLAFSANELNGTADRINGGPLRLKKAVAKSSVVIDAQSKTPGGDGASDSHVEAESLTMTELEATTEIAFDKPFTYSNRFVATGTDRTVSLRAPSGNFVLPLLSQNSGSTNPFQSADVKGPVHIDVDSSQKAGQGTAVWKIALFADSLTYSAEDRIMRLTGHVSGDVESKPSSGEGFGFNVNADWMFVYFDESGAVKTIKSGIGKVASKPGGGI